MYQSISNATFANVDSDNVYAIDTIYYLDARKALGPYISSAQYNLALNATDYIGFTANVVDEFDNYGVGAKYYTDLGQDRYLTASANINAGDYDSWSVASTYYFNQGTSVFANLNKQDDIRVGAWCPSLL